MCFMKTFIAHRDIECDSCREVIKKGTKTYLHGICDFRGVVKFRVCKQCEDAGYVAWGCNKDTELKRFGRLIKRGRFLFADEVLPLKDYPLKNPSVMGHGGERHSISISNVVPDEVKRWESPNIKSRLYPEPDPNTPRPRGATPVWLIKG